MLLEFRLVRVVTSETLPDLLGVMRRRVKGTCTRATHDVDWYMRFGAPLSCTGIAEKETTSTNREVDGKKPRYGCGSAPAESVSVVGRIRWRATVSRMESLARSTPVPL